MNAACIDYALLLETHNKADIAFMKSILNAYGIVHYVLGEYSAPYLYYAVPLRILVKKEQVEEARELLKNSTLSYAHIDFRGQYDVPDAEE